MLEHCDVVVAAAVVVVVVVAAAVVVSEDMVDDVEQAPLASAFASPGARALPEAPHLGNYCFGYCSSCLDVEDAVTCDNHPPSFGVLRVPREQVPRVPLTKAFPDAPAVEMVPSFPNAAFSRTLPDASAFFVAAVGPSS